MVVRGQSRPGKTLRLRLSQHAKRAADLHAERSHVAHHLKHRLEIPSFRCLPPGRAHAEPPSPLCARVPGRLQDIVHRQQIVAFDTGLIMRALRAVATVLGTPACLDGNKPAKLNFVRLVVPPMHLLRREDQVQQRLFVDLPDFIPCPTGTQHRLRLGD